MSDVQLDTALKALADPTRIRMVQALLDREMCVCEIADELKISQPLVSHHLRELRAAGLVCDHKSGSWVFVRLDYASVCELRDMLARLLGQVSRNPKESPYECGVREGEEIDVG